MTLLLALVLALAPVPDGEPSGSTCDPSTRNLVANGGFESPDIPWPYASLGVGDSLGAWVVRAGTVDLVPADFWAPASGQQSLDLDGSCGAGEVAQVVPVRAGHTYRICFDVAGSPDGPPPAKPLEIWWGTSLVDSVAIDATFSTRRDLRWEHRQYLKVANDDGVLLRFRSLTPGCYGPVLDNVAVHEIVPPLL